MKKSLGFLVFVMLSVLPAAAQTQAPIRVNCGGPAYTDSKGQNWAADYGFNGGSTYAVASPISGTADQKLYQSEHYGGDLIYSFPVANGNYTVDVLLAEIYPAYARAGARVLNMKVEGTLAFPNVDIFALVGANAALMKSASAVVSNGTLTVEITSTVGGAKCSAIEILPSSSSIPSGPPLNLNFTYPDGTPVAGALSYTVSSPLLSFQGSASLNNGQAQCIIYANPSSLGISAQFTVNLSLTDTAGHTLWQLTVVMDPSQVNLGTVQSSALNVVVQRIT